jgi:collagen triple helix repeat protein
MGQEEEIAQQMLEAVKAYVDRVAVSIVERFVKLEDRIGKNELRVEMTQAIPAKDGVDGKDGKDGLAGKDGRDGVDGKDGLNGKDGADGLNGKDGADGINGKDGRDGVDGKDGAPGLNGKDGADGLNGKDGESIRGEKGIDGKDGRDGRDAQDGKDGKDGADGRDALAIFPLDGIDETKTYPRGTWAFHRGGTICSLRVTDPITDGVLKAGWAVALEGIHTRDESVLDEGREVQTVTEFTSGKKVVQKRKTLNVIYRGIWKPENTFSVGDLVTYGGSVWHCEADTKNAPGAGNPDWKLVVKRGDKGKDGADAVVKPVAPLKL